MYAFGLVLWEITRRTLTGDKVMSLLSRELYVATNVTSEVGTVPDERVLDQDLALHLVCFIRDE